MPVRVKSPAVSKGVSELTPDWLEQVIETLGLGDMDPSDAVHPLGVAGMFGGGFLKKLLGRKQPVLESTLAPSRMNQMHEFVPDMKPMHDPVIDAMEASRPKPRPPEKPAPPKGPTPRKP